jgi:hypothetical protein
MVFFLLLDLHVSPLKLWHLDATISVVEPEPQGAGTFGWSRNIEVSAPTPGQLK